MSGIDTLAGVIPETERIEARVLIVDDEPHMRETMAEILVGEGYFVETVDCGERAVNLLEEARFDVILMDVRMEGIGGVEAFRRIRSHNPNARVVFMTGYSADELRRRVLDEGAAAFLPKPLHVETLLKVVSKERGASVLVIEDDQETSADLLDTLRGRGYRVVRTASPHHALELAEQIHFDVIFIESELPAVSGLDVYMAIKEITPTSAAIMISGSERGTEIAEQAVRRNSYCIVHKPLDPESLLTTLRNLTGQQASGEIRKPSWSDGSHEASEGD